MDNLLYLVSKYTDIDTRRAMGFPPRKLSSEWKDFTPHPYGREIFKYLVNNKTLLYYEFWNYDQFYSEITNGIVPEDFVDHRWRHLDGSEVYGVNYRDSVPEIYISKDVRGTIYTAGWPIFII